MSKRNVHVVRRGDQWAVVRAGGSRASALADTQREAEEIGRGIARNQGVDLLTHGTNGRIRSHDSFGNDPCPPRDAEH